MRIITAVPKLSLAGADGVAAGQTTETGDTHPASDFAHDFIRALEETPHRISPKYFYDAEGSRLFDRICALAEYYPTRTELGILRENAAEIAALMEPQAELIEFGAGSLQKAGLLLRAMRRPARFVPIDISGEHLHASVLELQRSLVDLTRRPTDGDSPLRFMPVTADYSVGPAQALAELPAIGTRYGFFPGSTIGNFTPDEALDFLRGAAGLLRGGALVLGTDLVKEPSVLHAAYNDARGVTAAFNRNLLVRANRELDADFAIESYAHSAFYNAPERRIEMHLVARRHQDVRLCGRRFVLREGETLHTENSYKFTIESVQALATLAGFTPGPVWTDADRYFAVHWLQAPTGPTTGPTTGPATEPARRMTLASRGSEGVLKP